MTKKQFVKNYFIIKIALKGFDNPKCFRSENDYANRFTTSRNNIRIVFKELVARGMLISKHGSGYLVNIKYILNINNLPIENMNSPAKLISVKKNSIEKFLDKNYSWTKYVYVIGSNRKDSVKKIIYLNDNIFINNSVDISNNNLRLLINSNMMPSSFFTEYIDTNTLEEDVLVRFTPHSISKVVGIFTDDNIPSIVSYTTLNENHSSKSFYKQLYNI